MFWKTMANFILTDDHYPTIIIDGVGVNIELRYSKTRFKVITEVLLKKMQVLRYDSVSMGEYFRHFAGSQCLHLQGQAISEEEGAAFLECLAQRNNVTSQKQKSFISEAIKNFTLKSSSYFRYGSVRSYYDSVNINI